RWWPRVNAGTMRADALAGLTNAIVVLPQGVAFALIAGLPPEYGLYTAMVPAVVAALFGSSWHLISGPTTPLSIVVFATLSPLAEPGSGDYITMALTLTLLAGLYQLAFGLARLGTLVNFVSPAVVTGFTTGAALLIATSQLQHVLGVEMPGGHGFIEVWHYALTHVGSAQPRVVIIAAVSLGVALVVRALRPKWPYLLMAMVAGVLAGWLLNAPAHGVPVIGTLPSSPPSLSMPAFEFAIVRDLAADAFAVALLGLIEAVSIARAVGMRSQQRIDPNQEFVGQGLSNMVGAFFSCYASSGSFTRTGINYEAGARTPISAIMAAVALMLVLLVVAPFARYLPIAAMGGMILVVAWGLIDWHHIRELTRASRQDAAILVLTFAATLLLGLTWAILAGVLLSLLLFLNRAAHPAVFSLAPDPEDPRRRFTNLQRQSLPECPQLKVIRIDGAVFFGSAQSIAETLGQLVEGPDARDHLLIVGSGINYIDTAGAQVLIAAARQREARGGGLYICSLRMEPRTFLHDSGYADELGRQNLYATKGEAIADLYAHRLDPEVCRHCEVRIFEECARMSRPEETTGGPIAEGGRG
ncbi:MAG: SulP family inorganic anion transporter, partial [Halofilum sp. (in: g-proteobacteria)]